MKRSYWNWNSFFFFFFCFGVPGSFSFCFTSMRFEKAENHRRVLFLLLTKFFSLNVHTFKLPPKSHITGLLKYPKVYIRYLWKHFFCLPNQSWKKRKRNSCLLDISINSSNIKVNLKHFFPFYLINANINPGLYEKKIFDLWFKLTFWSLNVVGWK